MRIPAAIPAPIFPNISMAMDVERDVREILTRLFPIRIPDSSYPGFSINRQRVRARLSPSSARTETLCGFTVVRAVSADEKKPERASKERIAAI